jgi:hypothetical protein
MVLALFVYILDEHFGTFLNLLLLTMMTLFVLSQVMAWYVVHCGRKPGVYASWDIAHAQVDGFKGACYKKFKSKEEADQAFYDHGKVEKQPQCEADMHDKPPMRQSSFEVTHVIILVRAVIIGFLIWKLMST